MELELHRNVGWSRRGRIEFQRVGIAFEAERSAHSHSAEVRPRPGPPSTVIFATSARRCSAVDMSLTASPCRAWCVRATRREALAASTDLRIGEMPPPPVCTHR